MNDFKLLPDDPKLTAYALGELEADERAAVERALRDDPVARAAVEEIRATAAQLEGALAAEAAAEATPPEVHPLHRADIIRGRDLRKLDGGPLGRINGGSMGKLIKFPQVYYVIGGLAAACFAVMVALLPPAPHAVPVVKHYTKIDLASSPAPVPVELPVMPSTAEADRVAEVPAVAPSTLAARADTSQVMPFAKADSLVAGKLPLLDQLKQENEAARLEKKDAVTGSPAFAAVNDASGHALQTFGVASSAPPEKPAPLGQTLAGSTPTKEPGQAAAQAGGAATVASLAPPVPSASATADDGDVVQLTPFSVKEARDAGSVAAAKSPVRTIGAMSTFVPSPPAAAERERGSPAPAAASANTEAYVYHADNDFLGAAQNPLSTFAIDVDTASYANVRRFLQNGQLPPHDAVRLEELVNYFPYRYPAPAAPEKRGEGAVSAPEAAPFAAALEVAAAPWAPTHRLVRIGLKGRDVATDARLAANLVFLLDVSGSMSAPNRLPLVKESMRLLVGKLRRDDRVAIVTYAGQSGLALPSTPVAKSAEILAALDALAAGGATNGAMGIQLAYDVAKANLVPGGINRVILCTDGDFNVGVTSEGELVRLIEEKAKSGVALTALGFGMGNYKDATIAQLADHGNGNYGYIDTRREAEKLLVEQVSGTLQTIAKDVKIQVEFNPAKVASYRLLGYENRLLKKEDFNNDQVDAGEIGAGHTVTALYEIVPVGAENRSKGSAPAVDALKYALAENAPAKGENQNVSDELLTVKLRYQSLAGGVSTKLEFPLRDSGHAFADASADFKLAAAVAEFAMILRDSPHKGVATMGDVIAWAAAASARDEDDQGGYRGEFLDLARKAQALLR